MRLISDLALGIINFSEKNNSAFIYPNPIHQHATLKYTLINTENISIKLFDVNGKLIETILAGQNKSKGNYDEQLNFDSTIPAGSYFLTISNGRSNETVKIIKQ